MKQFHVQEYYIKTDESEIIDEKRNYHIWNENISIDKLKADNYQLLLGTNTITLNPDVYSIVREQVVQKLQDRVNSYLVGLDI